MDHLSSPEAGISSGDSTLCVKSLLPVEAVNWSKQKQLARSASVWIDRHGRPAECYRFDVVGVLVEGDRVRVRHVANAFSLSHSA
jgi:Holliday junction resolvase-like predicted endonuclease